MPLSPPPLVVPVPQERWSQRRVAPCPLERSLPRAGVALPVQQILRLVAYQVCMPAVLCAEMPMQRSGRRRPAVVAQQQPNRWLQNFHSMLGERGKAEAGSTTSRMMTTQIGPLSISIQMLNLNRRHTEALEKIARTEERLADAEETIARHLGDFLRDEEADRTKPAHPSKKAAQKKSPPKK